MANLAGFDVIAEAHIETIIDLLNLLPFTNPIDGKRIHLFGGPFSTDLNLPLGPFGNLVLRVTIDASLKPVLRQSQATVGVKLSGGSSSVAGRALSNISGQVTVTVPLQFTLPSSAAPGDQNIPNLVLSGTSPQVTLDAASQAQANAGFGAGGAEHLTSGLRDALAALLNVAGTRAIPVMGFKVIPGIASDNPQVLSALPTVAWIDNTTLAVFGYYRFPVTGGDANRKTDSDIVQATEEFFSDDRGLNPGRRVALLMSADGFRRVVGCPAIRKGIITGLVTKRELQKWKDFVTARDGNDSQAETEMNAWLNSTAPSGPETVGGIAILEANTPPPCGRGTTEIIRLDLGITQSPVTPMLRQMEISLDEGRIVAKFNAGGNAELLTGDISFNVDGVIDLFVEASGGVLVFRLDVHTPAVTLSSGGLTALVLGLAKTFAEITGLWSVLLNLAGAYMRFELSQALNKSLPVTFSLNLPQDTLRNRVLDLQIHPQSILALGLVERKPSWNEFNPALFLDSSIDERISAAIPQPGQLDLPATDWGCLSTSFPYTRSFWDESFTVRARARDIPLPITLTNWRMDVGNITESWLLSSRIIDPRITWSNEIKPITAGTHTLRGNVEHLTELFVPSLDGPLSAANVTVGVTGDAINGWHIRLLGSDGNFFLRISVDARDGSGGTWTADTFITHKGEQVDLPPEYETYRRECDAEFQDWFARRAERLGQHGFEIANVGRGNTVIDTEVRESFVIRDLISRGDIRVFDQAQTGVRELGPQFLEKIGKLHLRDGI